MFDCYFQIVNLDGTEEYRDVKLDRVPLIGESISLKVGSFDNHKVKDVVYCLPVNAYHIYLEEESII